MGGGQSVGRSEAGRPGSERAVLDVVVWARPLAPPGLFRCGGSGGHSHSLRQVSCCKTRPRRCNSHKKNTMYLSNPICSPRLFLLRAGFRLGQGFLTGRLCSRRTSTCKQSFVHPEVSCPPRFPEGVECSRVEPAPRSCLCPAGLSPPHRGQGGGRANAQRQTPASQTQCRLMLPAHWPSPTPQPKRWPALPYGTPTPALGVGTVSYRWGNRGAERSDDWPESVSGWRAAFSSTPRPRGCAGRTSPSPLPPWLGPRPRSPAPVSRLPLCRRPSGLVFLLSVLSFQVRLELRLSREQKAAASNV